MHYGGGQAPRCETRSKQHRPGSTMGQFRKKNTTINNILIIRLHIDKSLHRDENYVHTSRYDKLWTEISNFIQIF